MPAETFDDAEVPEASQETLTAFADPVNFTVKHPLQNSWTLWFDNPGKKTNSDNWAMNLKKLVTFDTAEDFWGVYNNITPATQLLPGSNYHLFKEGVQPMWEDKANQIGGKWVVQIGKATRDKLVDPSWLNAVLACIGEEFEESDEICGLVMSVRKTQDRIALWTRTAADKEKTESIGMILIRRKFKEILQWPDTSLVGYQSHDSQNQRQAKDLYSV
ncbi:hypothetical protein HK096_010253 [Nowakowskiella sp. JEL0078]|nr:hypothetical protein HK096_010253 [Nowakowskiella sp. JEL0078]